MSVAADEKILVVHSITYSYITIVVARKVEKDGSIDGSPPSPGERSIESSRVNLSLMRARVSLVE